MQPFWYLHHWAFMLLKLFLLYLSHAVDITYGINFWYTTAMNSQWTITQYFFASKRAGLGDRKHTTCLMKIISNHKLWEILYVHYSIYVYYTTLLDLRFLKYHYRTLRHQYVNPAATLLHEKKRKLISHNVWVSSEVLVVIHCWWTDTNTVTCVQSHLTDIGLNSNVNMFMLLVSAKIN